MVGKYDNLILTERELSKITGISLKNFKKQNHLSLKNVLEKQPMIVNYKKAFCTDWNYGTLFFVYDSIISD